MSSDPWIEDVARVIYLAEPHEEPWQQLHPDVRRLYRESAAAVLRFLHSRGWLSPGEAGRSLHGDGTLQ